MDRCREFETRSPPSPASAESVDGAELKGVRGGVERRRGSGIESEGPWAERDDGKSP